jgi:hypothetical protein
MALPYAEKASVSCRGGVTNEGRVTLAEVHIRPATGDRTPRDPKDLIPVRQNDLRLPIWLGDRVLHQSKAVLFNMLSPPRVSWLGSALTPHWRTARG